MPPSDSALVRRMLAQDEQAFREFFDTAFPRLYHFALRRLRGPTEAAEEVVQAVLVRAVEKLDTFRGESSLFTWLCSMCLREIADWHRLQHRRGLREVQGQAEDARVFAETRAASGGRSAEELVQQGEQAARIRAILDSLPEHYGDVLEWKYTEDLSVKEIAERLGVSPKAAESTLTRARAMFRKAFAAAQDSRETPA